ncbi:Undecaprenyl pyrophosphate synthetase [Archaeoglobus sulfaticallidus PM70-1]|uniref:Tritrans,polycis-undecaprenyl-diphosphate synthase (geranylgeranyl-diphosphate specific) n=1 Tax=Archaeoglobus sulfaticallidus PM70-1 TaxID=387631 RepID=N0BAB8_9EURY|nr:polyprenyl diphosphate synthase [Archaeoglobus sulfaticallidus]AGK60529.1 Undecaprenyl pyrophosphate synthetase [Archaeoglobus sulfaticallidus PM70-1]
MRINLGIIYRIYEKKLTSEVLKRQMPSHIAIIMDGNRRYARSRGMPVKMGHYFGSKKAEEVLNWCWELRIKNLTAYAFSTENFRRDNEEKKNIFELMKRELRRLVEDPRIHKNKVRVRIIGRRDLLPESLIEVVEEVERRTKKYKNFFLNLAIAYGGRQEILDAIKNILRNVKDGKIDLDDIDENLIEQHLYTNCGNPKVDLLIRTGGEQRLSNFLPWQSAKGVAYFCDIYWPEFRKIDLLRAIRTWQNLKEREIQGEVIS